MSRPVRFTPLCLLALLAGCAADARTEEGAQQPASQAASSSAAPAAAPSTKGTPSMQLGNFSVSLAVKDLAASRAFYEKLGFRVCGGNQAQNWLILQNDAATIGLFQGMFPKNMLTFNPGWDRDKNTLTSFDDVRELQRKLTAQGLALKATADESTTGPAHIMLTDPDGNPILIDQHVNSPKK